MDEGSGVRSLIIYDNSRAIPSTSKLPSIEFKISLLSSKSCELGII